MAKEKIYDNNIVLAYKADAGEYALEVNRLRMIPDYRDGMKPVLRKVIYGMYEDVRCINHFVKSAKIVGDVMGNYHPHGDTSIYGVLCDACNWFKTKVPYCDPQGSLGTIQGDSPASSRYTEAKLSEFCMDAVLSNLKTSKSVVDWMMNYDNTTKEPQYLPVAIPMLLINGNFGIGVGLRSDIPKHNLTEVINATINLIKNPNADVVLIPDHCMPVEIIDTNWKAISNKGVGNYTARGIIDIEYVQKQDRYNLIIKSIPDYVSLPSIKDAINEMVRNKTLQLSQDLYDESSVDQLRVVIPLKKGVDPNYTKEYLYKKTYLQNGYAVNFEVLNGIELVRMSYKSYLQAFIDLRLTTLFRLYCNLLQDIKTEYHEKEAFVKIMESKEYNSLIKLIASNKKVNSDTELMELLISKLSITDLQAKYIMNASLKQLSPMNLARYKERAKILIERKDYYMNRITNESLILEDMIQELEYFKKKYGKPRVCKVISPDEINNIPKGDFKIIISNENYIKKVPIDLPIGSFRGTDKPKHMIAGCNTQNILLFDENGRVFKYPIHKLIQTDRTGYGVDLKTLIKHATGNIIRVIYEPDLIEAHKLTQKHYMVSVSESGIIKKMDIEDFLNIPLSGSFFTKVDDDRPIYINIFRHDLDIFIARDNKVLRFNMNDIPLLKRNAKGVKSIPSGKVTKVGYLLRNMIDGIIVTNNGNINRLPNNLIPVSTRGKAGTNLIRLEPGDSICTILPYTGNQKELHIKTNNGNHIIPIEEIPYGNTISKGIKMLPVKSSIILSAKLT